MHDLSAELQSLPANTLPDGIRLNALRLEQREIFSVRRELLVALYVAVATLVAGVGLLIKHNLDRIGPLALLTGILAAAALCYAVAVRAYHARRARSLGEDYVLLLGGLLVSSAVGYAEVQFHLFGNHWSRHLALLAVWHLVTAYLFRSRLTLSVALMAFAGWLGVEARFGTLFNMGPRSLLCALMFYLGGRFHLGERADATTGFRDVYRQFAVNFGFWGALALGADVSTRWVGAITLLVLAVMVGRAGLYEKRESYLLYAVGYSTIGIIWLETLILRDYLLASWLGLFTVMGAVMLLLMLRARLKESTA